MAIRWLHLFYPAPSGKLWSQMQGIWWLESREDWTTDGQKRIDPTLGADPMGILAYGKEHFSAQFMKRNRTGGQEDTVSYSGFNNTVAQGGYDAYFGTFEVEESTGKVAHTLLGSITPANIGMTVSRDLRVQDNRLFIQLETTTLEGEPIIRTLAWSRASSN